MKSLLVDALRAANEAETESEIDDSTLASDPPDASVATATDSGPAVAELELMEPGETVEVDENNRVPRAAIEAEFAESIVLPTDAGFGSANDNLKTRVLELAASKGSGGAAAFERLAVWTPLVCLLLAVCSFAMFSAWSRAAGGEHGAELRMGPAQDYSPGVREVDFVDNGLASRFAFIDAAASAGSDPQ